MLSADCFNLELSDSQGRTLLHEACVQGARLVVVRVLGVAPRLMTRRDHKGHTPLHLAAYQGHADIVSLLLQHGAEVDAVARQQWTALHYAAQGGHARVVASLLRAGAQTEARVQLEGQDVTRNAQELASAAGFPSVARMIAEQGGSEEPPHRTVGAREREERELSERRLLRLEEQTVRLGRLEGAQTSHALELAALKEEHRKRLDALAGLLSKIAPDSTLNEQHGDWLAVRSDLGGVLTRLGAAESRLGALEARLRYLEYIVLATVLVLLFF